MPKKEMSLHLNTHGSNGSNGDSLCATGLLSDKCPHGVDDKIVLVNQNVDILRHEQSEHFELLMNNMEEIKKNMVKISDTVLDPERGLYTRLKMIEGWKKTLNKIMWLFITSSVGVFVTKYLFFNK